MHIKPIPTLTESQKRKFWSHVDRDSSQNGCWLWTGPVTNKGYGEVALGNEKFGAHRISYDLSYGSVPTDRPCVLHDCPGGDNPACVNPAHLWCGTQLQNMRDMVAKERSNRGEKNGGHKLTSGEVGRIKQLLKTGQSQSDIGDIFGVRQQCISKIANGERWRHVIA